MGAVDCKYCGARIWIEEDIEPVNESYVCDCGWVFDMPGHIRWCKRNDKEQWVF